jgi:hypothetical protein
MSDTDTESTIKLIIKRLEGIIDTLDGLEVADDTIFDMINNLIEELENVET